MDNKITVIEGPTPIFIPANQATDFSGPPNWAESVLEGPFLYEIASTTVRTFNSQTLLERCERNWTEGNPMYFEYRDRIGLRTSVPIVAAKAGMTPDGEVLVVWVRLRMVGEEGPHEV